MEENQKKCKILNTKNAEKGSRGITLIALVITIIVLLILAGVNIMMLTGENGILSQAAKAKTMTDDAQVRENITMAYNNAVLKKYTEGSSDFIGDMTVELEKIYGSGNVTVTKSDDTYTVTINGTKYTFDGDTQIGGTGGDSTEINWKQIVESLSTNYEEYLAEAQAKGQTRKTNVGIGTDGKVVNLDLWHYYKTDDGEGMSLGDGVHDRLIGYDEENIVDGTIQGKIPQYIYVATESKVYPVTKMHNTFYGCTSLVKAPEIPSSVAYMYETFYGCTSLAQAPEIPSGVTSLSCTFSGCTSLTGTITINANPTYYFDCFFNTVQPITLTGSSTMLSELAETANNGNVSY